MGSKGTRASPPQAAQVAVKYSRGPRAAVLAGVTAGLAALGLVLEAALRIELLLTGGENELFAALFAYQGLVFVHLLILSLILPLGLILRSAFAVVA